MTINRTTQPEGEQMAQFTPGPWDAGNRTVTVEGADFTPVDAPEMAVAFVPVSRRADAHLIAAAPELYQALADVTAWLEDNMCGGELRERSRRVLTKARGGKA